LKLTVVIPTINRKTLSASILSTLNLRITESIIVVSNTELSGSLPDCRIPIQNITIQETDACSKRNAGLGSVKSEYVLFLDDDDQICSVDVEKYINILRQPDCIGLVFDARIKTFSSSRVTQKKRGKIFAKHLLLKNAVGTTSSVLLKACVLKDANLRFDERNICRQDFDMWIRILSRKGSYLYSTGEIGLEYLETDDPQRISRQKVSKKMKSLIRQYLRHIKMKKLYAFTFFNHSRYILAQLLK